MLWPKLDNKEYAIHLAYIGTIGENAVDNEEIAYNLVGYLKENYAENIKARYNVDIEGKDTMQIIEEIARKRGAIVSGGEINLEKISNIILNEFQSGKLGRITIEFPR